MILEKIFISLFAAVAVLLPGYFGVKEDEEKRWSEFTNAEVSFLRIRYNYSPKNFVKQQIAFGIDDAEIIEKLRKNIEGQRTFRSEKAPNTPETIKPEIIFYGEVRAGLWAGNYRDWVISFHGKKQIRIEYDQGFATVDFQDGAFYDQILNLAYENNKTLFPDCTIDEISLEQVPAGNSPERNEVEEKM